MHNSVYAMHLFCFLLFSYYRASLTRFNIYWNQFVLWKATYCLIVSTTHFSCFPTQDSLHYCPPFIHYYFSMISNSVFFLSKISNRNFDPNLLKLWQWIMRLSWWNSISKFLHDNCLLRHTVSQYSWTDCDLRNK